MVLHVRKSRVFQPISSGEASSRVFHQENFPHAPISLLPPFPPSSRPMRDPLLFVLALAYRIAFGVVGGWITARLAPSAPMRHALALGAMGTARSIAGAVVAIGRPDLGPAWYPIALVITALPSVWLGARLKGRAR